MPNQIIAMGCCTRLYAFGGAGAAPERQDFCISSPGSTSAAERSRTRRLLRSRLVDRELFTRRIVRNGCLYSQNVTWAFN